MKLAAVMDEIAQALQEVAGLRVFAYPPPTLTPPAGYVSYPQSIDFDQEYRRGGDQFTDLPVTLVSGKATTRAARDTVAAWASGDGPKSVKQALEGRAWDSCDDVTVTSAEFDVESIGGVPYLAVIFRTTVVGPGET